MPEKTKIMVFGTFDVLHDGHKHFFRQARKLARNPFLIVSIARDSNVKRIKGRKPLLSERQRLLEVRALSAVNRVVLGDKTGYLNHILKAQPNIIALGHDQKEYTTNLRGKLAKRGLMVVIRRLRPYRRRRLRSSLIKRSLGQKSRVVL